MFRKAGYLLAVLACLLLVVPSLNCEWMKLASDLVTYKRPLELSLDKAPRLNEPVKLTCIRQTEMLSSGEHEKITLEFERIDPKTRWLIKVPSQEVLVGGNINWEGEITGEPMEFSATIKFSYEGNWAIYARSAYFRNPDGGPGDSIFLNVGEEASSFGSVKNYAPIVDPFPDVVTEKWPITVDFDMDKPPLLNESFQITWGISTIRDITEADGGVRFVRMEGTKQISIPVDDVLIDGDIAWKGSLKKGSPLHFTATVKIPVEGDLSIGAWCKSYVELEPIFASFSLPIHVSKDKSIWGWTESHESKPQGPLPPPLPTPQNNTDM